MIKLKTPTQTNVLHSYYVWCVQIHGECIMVVILVNLLALFVNWLYFLFHGGTF